MKALKFIENLLLGKTVQIFIDNKEDNTGLQVADRWSKVPYVGSITGVYFETSEEDYGLNFIVDNQIHVSLIINDELFIIE